jgi:hypothetical protein
MPVYMSARYTNQLKYFQLPTLKIILRWDMETLYYYYYYYNFSFLISRSEICLLHSFIACVMPSTKKFRDSEGMRLDCVLLSQLRIAHLSISVWKAEWIRNTIFKWTKCYAVRKTKASVWSVNVIGSECTDVWNRTVKNKEKMNRRK